MKSIVSGVTKLHPEKFAEIVNSFSWIEEPNKIRLTKPEREILEEYLFQHDLTKAWKALDVNHLGKHLVINSDLIRINKVILRNQDPRYEAEFSNKILLTVPGSFAKFATHTYHSLY